MDIVFERGEATVRNIQEHLEDPPTDMAVRRMLHILEAKGFLQRRDPSRDSCYQRFALGLQQYAIRIGFHNAKLTGLH